MTMMANKHAKFSAFVVAVNASSSFAACSCFFYSSISVSVFYSVGCCPLSLFIEHSEHVWPFSLLSTGGLFGRFSFLCFMLSWPFFVAVVVVFVVFFTACIDAFFLLTTRWDRAQLQRGRKRRRIRRGRGSVTGRFLGWF